MCPQKELDLLLTSNDDLQIEVSKMLKEYREGKIDGDDSDDSRSKLYDKWMR